MKYLYFSSQHCSPCQMIKPQIMKHKEIAIIDVDKQQDIATQYGIMSIPTLLVLGVNDIVEKQISGTKISKWLKENFKNIK